MVRVECGLRSFLLSNIATTDGGGGTLGVSRHMEEEKCPESIEAAAGPRELEGCSVALMERLVGDDCCTAFDAVGFDDAVIADGMDCRRARVWSVPLALIRSMSLYTECTCRSVCCVLRAAYAGSAARCAW